MKQGQLIAWFRVSAPGESAVYWSGDWHGEPPAVFHTAQQLGKEGRAFLYQKDGHHCIQKISSRAKRFLDFVSAYPDHFSYRGV